MATREQKTCEACGFGGSVTVETRGGRTLCETCRERRERIATAVLAGLASNRSGHGPEWAAVHAVAFADALVANLDEPAASIPATNPPESKE